MSEPTNLTQHLSPNQDSFRRNGIALATLDHNPKEVLDFYHKSGNMPDAHPAVLYEIVNRSVEGDRLSRVLISLNEGRTLTIGTHFFYVAQGRENYEP